MLEENKWFTDKWKILETILTEDFTDNQTAKVLTKRVTTLALAMQAVRTLNLLQDNKLTRDNSAIQGTQE